MKKVVILLFLLATGVSLQAQTLARYSSSDLSPMALVDRGPSPLVSAHPISPLYHQAYSAPMHVKFSIPGEKKKKIGMTMTFLGAALALGSIPVIASADPDYYRTTYNQNTGTTDVETVDPKYVLGGFMIAAGVGVAIPGVIIWTKGIRQYNQYMREQGETGALKLGIGHGGATLSYRF